MPRNIANKHDAILLGVDSVPKGKEDSKYGITPVFAAMFDLSKTALGLYQREIDLHPQLRNSPAYQEAFKQGIQVARELRAENYWRSRTGRYLTSWKGAPTISRWFGFKDEFYKDESTQQDQQAVYQPAVPNNGQPIRQYEETPSQQVKRTITETAKTNERTNYTFTEIDGFERDIVVMGLSMLTESQEGLELMSKIKNFIDSKKTVSLGDLVVFVLDNSFDLMNVVGDAKCDPSGELMVSIIDFIKSSVSILGFEKSKKLKLSNIKLQYIVDEYYSQFLEANNIQGALRIINQNEQEEQAFQSSENFQPEYFDEGYVLIKLNTNNLIFHPNSGYHDGLLNDSGFLGLLNKIGKGVHKTIKSRDAIHLRTNSTKQGDYRFTVTFEPNNSYLVTGIYKIGERWKSI